MSTWKNANWAPTMTQALCWKSGYKGIGQRLQGNFSSNSISLSCDQNDILQNPWVSVTVAYAIFSSSLIRTLPFSGILISWPFIRDHRGACAAYWDYQVVKLSIHLGAKLTLWPEAEFAHESLGWIQPSRILNLAYIQCSKLFELVVNRSQIFIRNFNFWHFIKMATALRRLGNSRRTALQP